MNRSQHSNSEMSDKTQEWIRLLFWIAKLNSTQVQRVVRQGINAAKLWNPLWTRKYRVVPQWLQDTTKRDKHWPKIQLVPRHCRERPPMGESIGYCSPKKHPTLENGVEQNSSVSFCETPPVWNSNVWQICKGEHVLHAISSKIHVGFLYFNIGKLELPLTACGMSQDNWAAFELPYQSVKT